MSVPAATANWKMNRWSCADLIESPNLPDQVEGEVAAHPRDVEVLGEDQDEEDPDGEDDPTAGDFGMQRPQGHAVLAAGLAWCVRYHLPTPVSTTMPAAARMVNHSTLERARSAMTSAASSGPSEEPMFPPTWKKDWANPRRWPAARCATRDRLGVEDRRAHADQRHGEQAALRSWSPRTSEHEADEGEAHADGQGEGLGPAVRERADHGLQEGCGELECEGDQAHLGEGQVESRP